MVDASIGVAKTTEEGVGDGMVASQPGIEADRSKDILASGVGNKEVRDYLELLSNALI